jgi:hypothetical protein
MIFWKLTTYKTITDTNIVVNWTQRYFYTHHNRFVPVCSTKNHIILNMIYDMNGNIIGKFSAREVFSNPANIFHA